MTAGNSRAEAPNFVAIFDTQYTWIIMDHFQDSVYLCLLMFFHVQNQADQFEDFPFQLRG
jgi:hypothetical protein